MGKIVNSLLNYIKIKKNLKEKVPQLKNRKEKFKRLSLFYYG